MTKRIFFTLLVALLVTISFSGCLTAAIGPYNAGIYDGSSEPIAVTSNRIGNAPKTASITVLNVLGMVQVNDASIKALVEKAGITKVYYIDKKNYSILGLFSKETYTVYGE